MLYFNIWSQKVPLFLGHVICFCLTSVSNFTLPGTLRRSESNSLVSNSVYLRESLPWILFPLYNYFQISETGETEPQIYPNTRQGGLDRPKREKTSSWLPVFQDVLETAIQRHFLRLRSTHLPRRSQHPTSYQSLPPYTPSSIETDLLRRNPGVSEGIQNHISRLYLHTFHH